MSDVQVDEDGGVVRGRFYFFRDLGEVLKESAILTAPDTLAEHSSVLDKIEQLGR